MQIHLFNQAAIVGLQANNSYMVLDRVDGSETNPALLGPLRPGVNKIPFSLDDLPYFDTNFMCNPVAQLKCDDYDDEDGEVWDAPLKRAANVSTRIFACATENSDSYLRGEYIPRETRVTFCESDFK